MNEDLPPEWGFNRLHPNVGHSTVCGVTGCGKAREKGGKGGGEVLWGCWLCKNHLRVYERATASAPPLTSSCNAAPLVTPLPPPPTQPDNRKKGCGRGKKMSAGAMGVTMEDLMYMHGMAEGWRGMKGKLERSERKRKRDAELLTVLEKRAQDAEVEGQRAMLEAGRGTLQRQVSEWKHKYERVDERCRKNVGMAEEQVLKAEEEWKGRLQQCERARQEDATLLDEWEKRAKNAELEGQRAILEGKRGTLQRQVSEWKDRCEKAEEKVRGKMRWAKEKVLEAERKEKEAKADKHGFVKELQRRMEVGGVQMYCIEKGNEGMFVPRDQMHAQFKEWEK